MIHKYFTHLDACLNEAEKLKDKGYQIVYTGVALPGSDVNEKYQLDYTLKGQVVKNYKRPKVEVIIQRKLWENEARNSNTRK